MSLYPCALPFSAADQKNQPQRRGDWQQSRLGNHAGLFKVGSNASPSNTRISGSACSNSSRALPRIMLLSSPSARSSAIYIKPSTALGSELRSNSDITFQIILSDSVRSSLDWC